MGYYHCGFVHFISEAAHPLEDILKDGDDSFDPFETIQGDIEPAKDEGSFDPFQSIQGEDAFVAHFPESDAGASSGKTSSNITILC